MTDRDLGMNRPITRRDFVGGVAVAISGSLAWRWSEAGTPVDSYQHRQVNADTYPPVRTGMRGSHEGSYGVAHRLREGVRWNSPEESGEQYDLIVVGGGLSGLAAAWYFREAVPDARILSAGGFDPAQDIEAITVNRWPHGYAYGHDPETGQVAWMLDELSPERSPWIAARKPFGRIAIANSDAVADAMTEGAFRAAHLAIEALVSR